DHARGAIELERNNFVVAVEAFERALRVWTGLAAPYIAARIRLQLAKAYEKLGDADGARREIATARELFESVGAAHALACLASTNHAVPGQRSTHGLSVRELQVLQLVSSGMTNKAIATELGLSEKTVDRHISNIFAKLDVPTRAAATAYAYSHKLV
ncbi:MAG TPA: LuxR C-terminal-related transcriptional regulator, partial [Polyangiaceae bacterium]